MSTSSNIGLRSNVTSIVNGNLAANRGNADQTLREIPQSSFDGADGKRYSVGVLNGEIVVLKSGPNRSGFVVELKTGKEWVAANGKNNEKLAREALAARDEALRKALIPTGEVKTTLDGTGQTVEAKVKIPLDATQSVTVGVKSSPTATVPSVSYNRELDIWGAKVNAGITAAGPNTYSVEASSPIVWTNTNVDFKLTPKLTASVSDAGLVGAAAIDYRMNVKFNEQSKLYVNGTVALTGGPSDIRIGYEQKLSAFGTPVTLNGSYGITGEARTSVEVDRFVISVKTTDFNNYSGTLAIKF